MIQDDARDVSKRSCAFFTGRARSIHPKMRNNPMNTCGARTRNGKPCQRAPIPGKRRCHLHGGRSPGAPTGNQRTLRHGVYSRQFTAEEQALFPINLNSGTLVAELCMTRISLRRALAAEQQDEALELAQIIEREGGRLPACQRTYRRIDWDAVIDRLIGRIANLELIILKRKLSALNNELAEKESALLRKEINQGRQREIAPDGFEVVEYD